MRTSTILILTVIFFACPVFAETISQQSFQEMGYSGFENSSANTGNCQTFSFAKNLNQNSAEYYTVLSLHGEFGPVASEDANVTVFWNKNMIAEPESLAVIPATDFENGWYRLTISNDQLLEENSAKICLNNSLSTTSSAILPDSLFGTYKMADFKPEDFVQTVSNSNPLVHQEFSIMVSLHNSGSEAVDVNVQYRKPGISFKHLPFVKGQSSFTGTIAPDQTISFTYSIKATATGPFTLPTAIVYYTNEFGEPKKMVSNYPRIEVREPEIKIEALILNKSTAKRLIAGNPIPLQVALTNNGKDEIDNIAVVFSETSGLTIQVPSNTLIDSILPGETKYIDYEVTPTQTGELETGCQVAYMGYSTEATSCEPVRLLVESDSIPIEYIGGVVLVILAVLVYLFYHFR